MMQKYWKQMLLILLAGGFLLGILAVNLCGDIYFRSGGILTEEIWTQIKNGQVEKNGFFAYLLYRRLGVFLLLWLLGHTAVGILALSVYALWLGCAAGILLTLSFVQLGVRGILLTAACLLPQDLFYGMALVRLYRSLWDRGNPNWAAGGDPCRKERRKAGMVLLLNLPPMIAGILLECHVNPVWMQWMAKW